MTFLFSSSVFSQSGIDRLQNYLNEMKHVQAHFNQRILDPDGKQLEYSNGQFILSRPGKLHWHNQDPDNLYIIANGEKIWIYDVELDTVTIKKQNQSIKGTPASFIIDNTPIEQSFQIKINKNTPQEFSATLTPSIESSISRINVVFLEDKLRQMEMKDHLGQTTLLTFYNIKNNFKIKANQFSLTIPPNVDIIDVNE